MLNNPVFKSFTFPKVTANASAWYFDLLVNWSFPGREHLLIVTLIGRTTIIQQSQADLHLLTVQIRDHDTNLRCSQIQRTFSTSPMKSDAEAKTLEKYAKASNDQVHAPEYQQFLRPCTSSRALLFFLRHFGWVSFLRLVIRFSRSLKSVSKTTILVSQNKA